MEEKIFIPQSNLSFDIQRFVDLTNGQYTLEVTGITVTCYFTGITGDSVEVVGNNTVTIGGKTFTASNASEGAEIRFTGSENDVTRIDIKNVAVTTDKVIYTPTGSAGIAFGADGISLSGTVSTANSLSGKIFNTQGNITLALGQNDAPKIDNITYKSELQSSINVNADTVTLVEGTITVGADAESLTGKNFVVNADVTATFNLQNSDSVTINDIVYKATENAGSIKFRRGNPNALTGNFEITLAQGKSFALDGITFTADNSAGTFTYHGNDKSVTDISGTLKLNLSDKKISVNGVTYEGYGDLIFTNSLVTLDGEFTVGDGTQSLSGKNFLFNSSGKVTLKLAGGDSNVTVNGVTYTAGAEGLTLQANYSNAVTIYGKGATVSGTGNFVIANSDSEVNINGVAVTSTNSNAAISFGENNTVQNLSSISVDSADLKLAADATISNSTLNVSEGGSLTLGGVTYSGTGAVTVNNTNSVTLSGDSMNVTATDSESLKGKNISFTGEVKINGDTYSSSGNTGGSVSISSTGETAVSNSSVAFDENTPKTLSIKKDKDLTVGNVTYTGKSSDAQVEVKGTAVKITGGTVAVDNTAETYTVDLDKNATAQIGGVNFQKTSDSNSDADINVENGNITLNAGFTVGDGNTPLNGLTVTLTTSDQSTFNLGGGNGGNVTVIQNSGASGDDTGTPTEGNPYTDSKGVTYSGTGSVDVSGNAVSLSGTITVTSAPADYTFTLRNGTYKFGGNTSVYVTDTVSGVTANGNSVTIGSTAYSATGSVTLNVASGSVNSISGASSTVTVTIGGTNYTLQSGKTLTYTNGTWTGGVEYDSYVYDNGTMYGVYDGGSDTLTSYADVFNNNTVLTDKQLTYKGNGTVIAGGTTYTVNNGTATFTSGGIGSVTSGSVTYTDSNATTFTADDNKEYTTNSGVTYERTSTGTDVKTASGTRAYETGENATKVYTGGDGYTYDVTAGTYSIEITGGNGTATLTSGSATKIFSANDTFSYNSKDYKPFDGNVTYNISFDGDTITPGTKSGSGTRALGANETQTYNSTDENNSGNYTLSNGAIMKLTLSDGNESFYSGSATSGSLTSFKIGTNTYTGNATLTLTRSGGNSDTYSLASGSGTRSASVTTFTYPPGNGGKSYTPSGNVTYRLDTSGESLYAATSATSTDVSGDTYSVGNNTYNLTAGTYSLTFSGADYNVKPTLTSGTGTTTKSTAFTIKDDSKEYTPLNSPLTLTLTVNGTNEIESFTSDVTYVNSTDNQTFTGQDDKTYTTNSITYKKSGSSGDGTVYNATGTRAYDDSSDDVTFDYQGNNYTVTEGTYTYTVTNGNTTATPTLTTTTAVFTANTGATFRVNNTTDYTAIDATTFTLNSGSATPAIIGGSGTRSNSDSTFTYKVNNTNQTYTSKGAVTYILKGDNSPVETVYKAEGYRTNISGESYTTNGHNYNLTEGTYSINIDNESGADTFTLGKGSGTFTAGTTFTHGDQTYTASGNVTLNLDHNNSNANKDTETFKTGTGTRADNNVASFTTTDNKTYQTTGANKSVTYYVQDGGAENVYKASGTRAFDTAAGDSETDSYKGDTYKVTAGTYSINVNNKTGTESLTKSQATYSIGAGTRFHFGTNSTEYTATQATQLTLGYDASGNQNGLTASSGEGTRTAAGTDEKDNYSGGRNNGEYTLSSGAKIKMTLSTGTESFFSGSATRTTNSYTHTDGKVYTGTSLGLTWTKTNGSGDSISFTSGTGTRADSSPFVFSGKTYTLSSGQATYTLAANASSEQLLAAEGTRKSDGNDTFTGDWGNVYKIPNGTGTVHIKVVDGSASGTNAPTVTDGNATNTYVAGSGTFTYSDGATYTANHDVTLKLAVSGNGATKTETFESGSAQKNGTSEYIVKGGSKVTIDNIEYTASGSGIVTVNNLSETDGTVSAKITGNFSGSTTIGGISYASAGANSIEITDVKTGLKFSGGDFTATGDFSTARTITGNTFQVTGDTDNNVKATFNSSGKITKIENLGGTAEVTGTATANAMTIETNAAGTFTIGGTAYAINQGTATFTLNSSGKVTKIVANTSNDTYTFAGQTFTIKNSNVEGVTFTIDPTSGKVTKIEATKSNGTYTFGSQIFKIENDADEGVTFTIDPTTGTANKIEGLQRTDDTYAHVTVTDDGETTNLYVRRDSDNPEKTNGKWTDKDIINFYYVKYDGTFKVQAVDKDNNSTLVEITATDYTSETGTPPTLTFSDTSKKIVVENTTDTAIKVGNLKGEIKNTSGNAIRIDANGDFKLGTFEGITFTESKDGNFDVSTDAEFTVDSTGKITVSAKDTASSVIDIEAPTNANIHINTAGTFKVNGVSILQIENEGHKDVELKFDSRGNVSGIKANGAIKVTVMPTAASSSDLGESADTHVATSSHFQVEGSNLTYVTVLNDYNSRITYVTDDAGNLTALSDIDDDAIIILDGDSIPNALTINGHDVNGTIAAGKKIKLNSTTANYWYVEGDTAPADDSDGYRAVINADNTISLYSGSTQTKNVNDYKAVFGANGPQPTKDDGDLPTYPSGGITIEPDVLSELEINVQTSATYKINEQDITIPGRTIIKPVDGSFSSIEVDLGAQPISYDEMNFTGNGGTSKATLSSSAITLNANAKVTNVSGKTFTATGTVTFDDVTIENLNTTKISGVTTNTNNTALTIDSSKAITVNGDKTYSIDVTTSGSEKITGISNGAQVTANDFEIETDSAGTFKVGGKDFVVAGDDKVTFTTNDSGAVETIKDLSAAGSITGDFSAEGGISVNTKAVEVASDTNIGVVGGSGTVSKIYNVTGDAVVKQAGGAATISTDGAGTFTFGDPSATNQKYNISAGTADFLSSAASGAPVISGIKNVSGSATVSVYQAESNFAVNGNSITFTGDNYDTPLQLAMGGDTISTVEGLLTNDSISGLTAGAVVKGTDGDNLTVNNKAIQVTGSAFEVHAAASGYSSVTGVEAGATFNTVEDATALLIPNAAGTYKFGDTPKTYTFSAAPTLKADGDTLKEVIGLTNDQYVQIFQAEEGLKVGNNTIILTRDDGASGGVKLTMGNGNVSTVESMADGDAIKGLSAGTIVKTTADASLGINNSTTANFKASNAANVRVTASGYDSVTGFDAGTQFKNVANGTILIPTVEGEASYIFGDDDTAKTYKFSAKPILKTAENALASIGGLTSGQYVELQAADELYIGSNKIKLEGDNVKSTDKVKFTMGDNNTVASVDNLKDSVSGLSAGVDVKIKATSEVAVNTKAVQINDSDSEYTVKSTAGGYGTVSGITDGAFIEKIESGVIVIPDAAGTFKFVDAATAYEFSVGSKPTLVAGANSALASIGGLTSGQYVELQAADELYIGSNKIKLEGDNVKSTDKVKFTMGDNNTVASVDNLKTQ